MGVKAGGARGTHAEVPARQHRDVLGRRPGSGFWTSGLMISGFGFRLSGCQNLEFSSILDSFIDLGVFGFRIHITPRLFKVWSLTCKQHSPSTRHNPLRA